jgi:tetratricopeptide (TPR) repeat protein
MLDFDSLWDYDDPAGTEQKFREVLPQAAAAGDSSLHAELLTQIARAQGLQRQFDAAHATLDTVEAQLDRLNERAKIRYLLERGRVFNSSKQRDKALPLFQGAWDGARVVGEDSYAVDAAHMIAIAEKPENQLAWNLKALEAAEASNDIRARNWLGALYNNIGWTYHDAGQYVEALATFQKALAWRETQTNQRATQIAKWCVARALRSLGCIDEALKMQTALLAEITEAGVHDGYVNEEIGECLLLLNRTEEAKPHFAAAYAELSKDIWLVENEHARLERLKSLST